MDIKPIRTKGDYEATLEEIEPLMRAKPIPPKATGWMFW